MSDISGVIAGDILLLLEEAGEEVTYQRRLSNQRDPVTREVVPHYAQAVPMPAALLEWKQGRSSGDGGPVQRTRGILIAHHGWEPQDGDTLTVSREGRTYTVSGQVQGYTIAGGTVAWLLRTTDGR